MLRSKPMMAIPTVREVVYCLSLETLNWVILAHARRLSLPPCSEHHIQMARQDNAAFFNSESNEYMYKHGTDKFVKCFMHIHLFHV